MLKTLSIMISKHTLTFFFMVDEKNQEILGKKKFVPTSTYFSYMQNTNFLKVCIDFIFCLLNFLIYSYKRFYIYVFEHYN